MDTTHTQTMIAMLAARQLGVSTRTLSRWADQGKIKAGRTAAGWRTFDPHDVQQLKKEMLKRRVRENKSDAQG